MSMSTKCTCAYTYTLKGLNTCIHTVHTYIQFEHTWMTQWVFQRNMKLLKDIHAQAWIHTYIPSIHTYGTMDEQQHLKNHACDWCTTESPRRQSCLGSSKCYWICVFLHPQLIMWNPLVQQAFVLFSVNRWIKKYACNCDIYSCKSTVSMSFWILRT